MGPARYHDLLAEVGSAASAWTQLLRVSPQLVAESEAALEQAGRAMHAAEGCGAELLLATDDGYPTVLLELGQPPARLFALGRLHMLAPPIVAIVGTRSATHYGERTARSLSAALSGAGVSVISGMARGIDGIAHRAALATGGRSVAVLGTGVDIAYPAAHRALHAELARQGLLISEELPGTRATPGSFPRRNRLIAALAQALIVVEAGTRSGAMITAAHALELGRTIAAVPGPIDAPQSAGANLLLRDGAIVIAEAADALALLGLTCPTSRPPIPGDPATAAVWRALEAGALGLDALAARAGLPARECLAAVSALELSGAVECGPLGDVRRL